METTFNNLLSRSRRAALWPEPQRPSVVAPLCPNCLAGVQTGRLLDAAPAEVRMLKLKDVPYHRGVAELYRCPECRARFYFERK